MGHYVFRSLLYVGGFSIPILLLLCYFWSKGILEEFYFWGWAYNFNYIAQGGGLLTWDYYLLKGLSKTFLVALGGFLIWFLGLRQVYQSLRSWGRGFFQKESSISLHVLFCVLWFVLSFIPISLGGRFFYHYFVQLIPPLCLLAALPACQFWNQKKYRPALAFFSLLPLLIFMPESTSKLWEKKKNFEIVGEYVRNNSNPKDRIFIWGFFPRAYFFTKRKPASRFLFCDFLTGSTSITDGMDYDPNKPNELPNVFQRLRRDMNPKTQPLNDYDTSKWIVPRAWPHLWEDLEKNKPVYFIDTAPANNHRFGKYPLHRFPDLKKFIESHYQLEITIAAIDLYKRK